MTTIGASLGGSGAVAPGGQPENWMRPAGERRTAVDWSDPKYATPHPAAKTKLGRRAGPIITTPQLPERNIRVKSISPAAYYTLEGAPIPSDQFVTVPISPSLMQAIKDKDLERGPDPEEEPHGDRHRRHRTHANPVV